MSDASPETNRAFDVTEFESSVRQLTDNICRVVLGKLEVVQLCVIGLLAGEHVLLEDVPGVGKTLMGRTQREFSQQVAHWIDTQLNRPTVKNLPGKITEAYYQLRFGGRELTRAERDSIDQALTQLEQALAQPAKH